MSPALSPAVPRDSTRAPRAPGSSAVPLRIALVGCGVVGRAFLAAAAPHVDAGRFRLVAVSDRSGTVLDADGFDAASVLRAKARGALRRLGGHRPWSGAEAARQAACDVVVDVAASDLAGSDPAREPTLAALGAGRHVVTASKAALALFPHHVAEALARSGRSLLASASVAGAVPVLETLRHALRGSAIDEVAGAWNAASTFVLSRIEDSACFDDAVAEARRLGYLEEDPRADFDGRDAAAKASIVAQTAFGVPLALDDVRREGLGGDAFLRAREGARRGERTRLVARVTREGASVAPETLAPDDPLAATGGDAAVVIRCADAGVIRLRGPGAGGAATASAVLSDLLALAAHAV